MRNHGFEDSKLPLHHDRPRAMPEPDLCANSCRDTQGSQLALDVAQFGFELRLVIEQRFGIPVRPRSGFLLEAALDKPSAVGFGFRHGAPPGCNADEQRAR